MISNETAFAESLERIRRIAREQGNCIEEEQVREEFFDLELNDAQLEVVFAYLKEHGIGVGEPVNPDACLTEEEKDYLQNYLEGLEALPVCSDGERRAYTISAMAGDKAAAQRLTESYLKDVADIARLYTGQGVMLEDLIGEGNVALALSMEMLGKMGELFRAQDQEAGETGEDDPSMVEGIVIRRIMDAMEDFIRENADTKKQDRKVADRVNKVADRAKKLAGEFHRKVTPEELMQESGMSVKFIQDTMRMSGFQIEDIANAQDSV